MKAVVIEKVEIKIDNKTLQLTPDEAKELRDVLEATFPTPLKKEYVLVPSPVLPTPFYPSWDDTWRRWTPHWQDGITFSCKRSP